MCDDLLKSVVFAVFNQYCHSFVPGFECYHGSCFGEDFEGDSKQNSVGPS